ncbi:hypothetical protein Angca_005187, partial [Angiostrongylus cantonensis]
MLSLLLIFLPWVLGEVANYKTIPKGINPTLYSSDDFVIQLDDYTFNDTIFCTGRNCTSYLVEFYSDWCGHCRSFAPLYKELANDVRAWQDVVQIAAINCADSVNHITCQSNGVHFFPFIKYFPRNSTYAFKESKLRPYHSLAEMRDQLTKVVMDDYSVNRFEDWPKFDYLGDFVTWDELWDGSPASAEHLAVVFENHQASLTGAQLLLDLHMQRHLLVLRRCLRNHPLADALHLTDFPSLVIFKRGEKKPNVVSELRRLLLSELKNFMNGTAYLSMKSAQFHSRKNRTNPCDVDPEKCRELFYASEVDMLKAMRYALYRESSRTGGPLTGTNLTALHSFVGLLADHFPMTTTYRNNVMLEQSMRAVKVFARLREFIENRGLDSEITTDDWQKEFIAAEEEAGNPFAVNSDWEHCRGSSGQYRGYTCGLWVAFHAITVSAYKQASEHLSDFKPAEPLKAIRAWIVSFFGCLHCRQHFLKMTTYTLPIETQVRNPDDVFMYLWRTHNIVNARLQGRDTEDPLYPKVQFPATFLCQNCTLNGSLVDKEVRNFLLDYYSRIKPFQMGNFFL